VGDQLLNEYDVTIYDKKDSLLNHRLEEIWAKIMNITTGESMDVCIWWKDDKGRIHDESPKLPIELRDIVDNAWIENLRK
jgi:hypothetical protein